MRRFGEPVERDRRYIPRPGAYAIIEGPQGLLVTEQSHPYFEIQLPGGGIDPGESPLRALHREVMEETGWTIAAPRRLGAFQRFTFMPEYEIWAQKVCHIYLCRAVRRLRAPSEPAHRAIWMDPDEAAAALGNAGDRDFVTRLYGLPASRMAPRN
ncbi:NUDIX hydrolase [Oceanomicrobium pacificus]|uniref:NUDIX domain-containing protein n=1 Tax=Oceanomicrobium pacificus TaxID=2692916 RepID=A0A6B0TKD5_9RHOB|nr:NUDIX hydrolase [Oceanomicrobium pacificus]MXU64927.1 NUDIX domain-containing protein [Oceanomicrobium pacificus]